MKWSAAVVALCLWAPDPASAFCGFYVGSAEGDLVNEGTMVVLLRDGTTTVLSMQNDYRGPPEDFALVVPVPVVLSEAEVRTLPADIFSRVERLASPRLVEYWEQDPCPESQPGTIGLGSLGTIGHGAGGGSGSGYGSGGAPEVTVEAEFAVGEYDIVILSARDSGALDAWLRANGYRIPAGAGAVLRPYVEAEMKFFVAKVNAERVTFAEGRAVLSPLRVHYDSDEFSLPVRLGLLNSQGAQDLIVHVLARNQRYEVANYENITMPTNLDVTDATREHFGEFYAALFDTVVAQHPGTVVTEYAWQASGCDPCPGPVLDTASIMTLGGDVIIPGGSVQVGGGPRSRATRVPRVRMGRANVQGALDREIVRRVVRRHVNEVRFCYEQQLQSRPDLEGRVTVDAIVSPTGAVQSATIASSTLSHPGTEQCIVQAFRRWTFPTPQGGGIVRIRYPFVLAPASAPGVGSGGRGGFGGGGFGGGGFGGGGFGRGRGPFQNMVLTRLHYRYGREDLGEDLVFRPAAAVTGGRERRGTDNQLEEGSSPSDVNNFQARYAIRHEWEGAMECESPRRGVWGGPPSGMPSPGPAAATNLAQAPRGGVQLGGFLNQSLASLGLAEQAGDEGPDGPRVDDESAAPPSLPTPTPSPPTAAAVDEAGCGCRIHGSSRPAGAEALLAVALGLLVRRRR